jgi:hypothetical protein
MKKCLWMAALGLVLGIAWGGESLAQGKKEMKISGTHYWLLVAIKREPGMA